MDAQQGQGTAPQTQAQPSVHERLKAFLNPQPAESQDNQTTQDEAGATLVAKSTTPVSTEGSRQAADSKAPEKTAQAEDAEADEDPADVPEDDAQTEETQLSTLKDLAEATGLDLDKILDLELPTRIDGKDGTARLRDLQKSYQLDGHINQKLASLDNDRKTFHVEREKSTREAADRLLKLDSGVRTLERALMGEFSAVDWQKLQAEDPVAFNAQWIAYQQRYAVMQDIAAQIAQEQKQAQAAQQEQAKAWVEEQKKLFTAKIPEWADDGKRSKDRAEIAEYLKGYGITNDEFAQIVDHRHALVVRDAWKWHQLQKSKPTIVNKVKAAPKLLKPGTQQSRAAQNNLALQKDRERLKQTGRARDAAQVFKRLGIV